MKPELDDTLAAPTPAPLPAASPAPALPRAPTPGSRPPPAVDVTHTVTVQPGARVSAPGPGPTDEAPTSIASGRQLGHFRIERLLGAGGMGEVYLATDLALDRSVAVKVLPERLAEDPGRRERMIREARAQARVAHPNVAHMYFVGEEAGRLFFAMEYVAGQTLGERIAAGPLPVEEALAVVRSAALGLREAQRSGFTHRDVKPSNLMIDGHGIVKVLDFGLAAGDPHGAVPGGPVAQTSLAGTPLYMAPEQARGDAVDFRADIYALGATLYHLVSGEPPFRADTVDALVSLHASAARPALRRRGISRPLAGSIDALVARMMAPRAADRFASYDELVRALELASTAQTRPAGFWVRAIANGIDLVLATLVAVVIILVASLARDDHGTVELGPVLLPLYAAYVTLATGRFGRTLGQSLFELEVVELDNGRRPDWLHALGRTAAALGLPTISTITRVVAYVLGIPITGFPELFLQLLWLANAVILLWAALRASGKRTPWDRISRTRVRYRTSP